MWVNQLKDMNLNIHVIATGAGASLQNVLWEVPGSSSYLSGGSFPYSAQEQEELLGFMPEQFCCQETAIDLASTAYMKAYSFNGKRAVGIGLTASVSTEVVHRGDHRVFACVMTDDKTILSSHTFEKGAGIEDRKADNRLCDVLALALLRKALGISEDPPPFRDVSALAKERFFLRPFFTNSGKRLVEIPKPESRYDFGSYALMPGAFNPPHQGHFGIAHQMFVSYGKQVIFEITAEPPHKEALTVQQLLQRAKLLQGHDRVFTQALPLYLDKARAFPGMPLVLGVDAMQRMLDPKWGLNAQYMLEELKQLNTHLYVNGRIIKGELVIREDIEKNLPSFQADMFHWISHTIRGHWDYSSTAIRNKIP
jgi:nicotinamide mononucleotide (NMN) deamidase PncC